MQSDAKLYERGGLALVLIGAVAGGVFGARYMKDFARLSKNTSEGPAARAVTILGALPPLAVV